jgi:hypothetical protein
MVLLNIDKEFSTTREGKKEDSTILVAKNVLDPTGGIVGVKVEVVKVVVDIERTGTGSSADGVRVIAVRSHDARELVHAVERVGGAGVVAADRSTAEVVVGLVGNVSVVTEEKDGTELVTRAGRGIKTRVGASANIGSTKDVSGNVGTLRVSRQDELGTRALLGVGSHLVDAVGVALLDSSAVVAAVRVVEEDVLVTARIKTVADGSGKLALTTRVRLVPAFAEEDVRVLAGRVGVLGCGCRCWCRGTGRLCGRRRRRRSWHSSGSVCLPREHLAIV